MPSRIRKETDNVIVFCEEHTLKGSFLFALGAPGVALVMFYLLSLLQNPNLDMFYVMLLSIIFSGGFMASGLYYLLKNESVTIDKMFQSVTIKKDSIQRKLNSVKEIPFSNIENLIYFNRGHGYSESDGSWVVKLITIQGDFEIYHTSNESNAEILAEKIREIISKEILYYYQKDSYQFRWQ